MCSDRFDMCALAPVERAPNDLSFTSSRDFVFHYKHSSLGSVKT